MSFTFKTERFEGPLDLLLELIENRKLLVNDISIAQVTDDYLAYVATIEAHSLEAATRFVALAATLLLIKSRSLLPVFEVTREEEAAIDDLETRLRVYQIYRDGSKLIARRFGATPLFVRPFVPDTTAVFTPDTYTTKQALREAIGRILERLPVHTPTPIVHVKPTITLESMLARMRERLTRSMRLTLRDLANDGERATLLVGFLAILELVRRGEVEAEQTERHADIYISRGETIDVPRYV